MESTMDISTEDMSNITLDNAWTATNENGQNILYITVEYGKDGNNFKVNNDIKQETYNDFETHVSPLDPNMSSVARYSPVYTESNSFTNPVVVTRLVSNSNNGTSYVCNLSNAENLTPEINTTDIRQVVNSRFLHMVNETDVVHSDTNTLPIVSDNEHEVELLITDQATGISYSVNTQQYLVEQCLTDNQLLETLNPDPLLESDLLTLDENTLKTQLSEIELNTNESITRQIEDDLDKDLISKFDNSTTLEFESGLRRSQRQQSFGQNVDTEEQLLSCMHLITDKPVPSRARATLPENYLSINKLTEGYAVLAKRCIPKSTQFGPLEGIILSETTEADDNKLAIFLESEDGKIQQMDISDENVANWMCYVRKATTYTEQNLVLMQQGNSLYYITTKPILAKQELMVGYSSAYAQKHNLHILSPPCEEKNSWHCFECSQSFSSSQHLQDHLNVHDDCKDENSKPKKKILKKKLLKKRPKSDILQCNECKEVFYNPKHSTLKEHMSTHSYEEAAIQDKYTVIRSRNNEQFRNKNQRNRTSEEANRSEINKEYLCSKCNVKFDNIEEYHSHFILHTQENNKKNYRCSICYKIFATRERIQRHMLVHGSDESKPYLCDKCAKRFLSTSALACHRKTHTFGRKIFECPICKENFVHVLLLKEHTNKHCIDGKFTCPVCNKLFNKYSIIRKHIRAFHCERKHTCSHCDKSFPTLDKLRMHLLRHSDHREFLCADCGKQFKRKDKLKEHARRMHSEERENNMLLEQNVQSTKRFTPKVEPTDYHRFIYKCHTCMVGFKRRGMLVNHLAKRHPEISPDTVPELNLPILRTTRDYYCQYCDKVYKSSSKRKAHILKNHPGAELPISNRKIGANENPDLPNATYSHAVGSITTHPQYCQWCHKQYASKAKLLQHQRKKHAELLELSMKQDGIKNEASAEQNVQTPVEDIAIDAQCFKRDFKVSDELINEIVQLDDVREQQHYYHLVPMSVADSTFTETSELNGTDSRLYRLLTTGNNMVPPR